MISRSVLIVEDDISLQELLTWHFEAENFQVRKTSNGAEALLMVREIMPDIVLLDWMIEEIPGIEVCRQLRRFEETTGIPIIIVTARDHEEDRIRGLETGADDFITKPFSPRELVVRANALLRRTRPASSGKRIRFADLELDPVEHRVRRNGRPLHMGPKEFRLLTHLMERPRRVHSREQLLDAVWGVSSNVCTRCVDVQIRRLRKAINMPGERDLIRTIRGTGYAMDLD